MAEELKKKVILKGKVARNLNSIPIPAIIITQVSKNAGQPSVQGLQIIT
jgi:hypothetical protein